MSSQCCGSMPFWCGSGSADPCRWPVLRIRDVYPGSWFFTHPGSRIQKQHQKRGVKKNLLSYLLLLPQISQNWKLFYLWQAKEKKFGPIEFSKNYRNFYPTLSSRKYGFGIREPRSGIRKKPIPDPGVKKAPDPGPATLPLTDGSGCGSESCYFRHWSLTFKTPTKNHGFSTIFAWL